jgi:hypothetical protein
MGLLLLLVVLLVVFAYGGIALSPILWLLVAIVLVVLVFDLIGVTDAGTGVRRRRW